MPKKKKQKGNPVFLRQYRSLLAPDDSSSSDSSSSDSSSDGGSDLPLDLHLSTKRKKSYNKCESNGKSESNKDYEGVLRSSLFQNGVDELPFQPEPYCRKPKLIKPTKVKPTVDWDPKVLFPNNKVYPPKPTRQRSKSPPYDYVLPKYVRKRNNFTFRPSTVSAAAVNDDDENEDYDANDDVKYQHDDYDGVDNDCSKHRAKSTDNIVSNSISSTTFPLATPSSSTSTTLYEETPLEKVAKLAYPVKKIAGRRRVTQSIKNTIISKRSVAPKGSYSSSPISSSDLEMVNDNEISQGGECQDCNPNELQRSGRNRKPTEKFISYTEDINTVPWYMEEIDIVPTTARSTSIASSTSIAQQSNHHTRNKINGLYTTLEGVWNKECKHCGYMHLDCATPHMLSNCCYNGKLSPWDNDADEMYSRYAYLEPLSKQITDSIMENIEYIGKLSAAYNNVLSICRIGVENGNRETGARNTHEGGFELRLGDSAFVIGGRMYHCTPKTISNTDPSCK